MKSFLKLILLFVTLSAASQTNDFTSKIYETYDTYKETTLEKRRIKHQDIQPLINTLKNNPKFTVKKVGQSIEGRDLSLISIGSGKTNVFLWSQMHGDEPTATQAIFDIFNLLTSKDFSKEKETILKRVTLHFLPMLNPDGAEKYTRRNTLGIDINRDALRLQSLEGQTLKRVRDSLNADFGFNLHDQNIYYNAERTNKPATISYLAPAYNYEKDINQVRGDAMKIIIFMNNIIQKYAPGQVGRYNDAFEPRAFGDNIQKWGTSTILIESGGYKNDVEKQEIRKLNYVSILSAIYTIANGQYKNIPIDDYENIPRNDSKLFDLKIEGATYNLLGKPYKIDIGVKRYEVDNANHSDFYNVGRIADLGDLSTFYGYNTFNAEGYTIVEGKVYSEVFDSVSGISNLDVFKLLKSGYTYIQMEKLPESTLEASEPIHLVKIGQQLPEFRLRPGINPTFLLQKDGINEYAVINGFLIDLNAKNSRLKNALIYR
ncbi:M14 family zinc carboxypeptidase [Hwangdonia lutea]|uniref:M14 family zinc carboxypeptidase n=1 Tax=Hwangdonia lutea TaxID=3075823 RepID=A0AA97HRS6_9FLAO|nr:M14 family zinc carboxypeptidase [Hwangdonia sp. SCSIO 19198]WOD44957.1 M14 family zinc carboxypeptidase [Hwangdonia sp. SCSIO 19198]